MFIAPEPESLDRAAIEDNDASADALPNTFVDIAELVWRKLDAGQTQQAVADELGWTDPSRPDSGRVRVAQAASMRKLDAKAWDVVTAVTRGVMASQDEAVTDREVVFTENLLRSILALTPAQQLDLVTRLAAVGARDFHRNRELHAPEI